MTEFSATFLDIPAQERVSLGIVAADDIIADLRQAIDLMHLPV